MGRTPNSRKAAGQKGRPTGKAPQRTSGRPRKLSLRAAAQQAASGTSEDDGIVVYSSESDPEMETSSDGEEWAAPKQKTRRAPAKRKTPAGRKHARKGKEPAVAAERRRATETMLEKLDIDGLSEIDDGTLATIELESGVTLKCSVSQALLDALWSKCEELKAQIEVLVHKYERRLGGEKIIVSLPRVTSLEELLSLETVMYMH